MNKILDTIDFAHFNVDTVAEKLASDILLMDVREQSVFSDYFLICSTRNERQLQAVASSLVQEAKKEHSILPLGVEGKADDGWMLIDFGDVMVHVFSEEQRTRYRLENLWEEAHVVVRMA